MRKVVAMDFDGTLCFSNFPDMGAPCEEGIRFVKECNKRNVAVILWTCRGGESLAKAVDWCYEQGIWFDGLNDNLKERVKDFEEAFPNMSGHSRKIGADIYIDDRNLGGINWPLAFKWLEENTNE